MEKNESVGFLPAKKRVDWVVILTILSASEYSLCVILTTP